MFKPARDGEWIQPIKRGYRVSCCDCGLVHQIVFRIRDGRIQFKAVRDEVMTASNRRSVKMKFRRDRESA
jgi:hypothetical protein